MFELNEGFRSIQFSIWVLKSNPRKSMTLKSVIILQDNSYYMNCEDLTVTIDQGFIIRNQLP